MITISPQIIKRPSGAQIRRKGLRTAQRAPRGVNQMSAKTIMREGCTAGLGEGVQGGGFTFELSFLDGIKGGKFMSDDYVCTVESVL